MKWLAFDTETDGLGGPLHRLGCMDQDGEVTWETSENVDVARDLFEEADCIVAHNLKYDAHVLARKGIELPWDKCHDTLVMAALVVPGWEEKNLLALSQRYLGYNGQYDLAVDNYCKAESVKSYADVPDRILRPYTTQQLENTLKLFAMWLSEIPKEAYDLEMKVVRSLFEMEERGVPVDTDRLARTRELLAEEIYSLDDELNALARPYLERAVQADMFGQDRIEFNPSSPADVAAVMKAKKKPLPETETGRPSVSREALSPYSSDPFVQKLLEYRELEKIKGTYVENLLEACDEDGVIRPNFSNTNVRTFRLSCSRPNLQNQAKSDIVRSCFIVRPHYRVVSFDFSQIEFLMAVFMAGDTRGIEDFHGGVDVHTATAEALLGGARHRQRAKTINFAVIYGMTTKTMAKRLGISVEEAESYIENFFDYYSGMAAHRKKVLAQARDTGWIKFSDGRIVHLQPRDYHKAYNYMDQGETALVVKKAMNDVADFLRERPSNLLLQIHDELVVEIHESEDFDEMRFKIEHIMEDASQFPFRVDQEEWKGNWAELDQVCPF